MSLPSKPDRPLPDLQFWANHVKSCRKSQHSQVRYCRDNKLKLSTFRYWERKLRLHESRVVSETKGEHRSRSSFIDVTHVITPQNKNFAQANPFLEIEFGQSYKLKVPPNWDMDNLRKILALVKELVCSSI
jgi:hypothetical protein